MILEIQADLYCEFELSKAGEQMKTGQELGRELKRLARTYGWSLELRHACVHGEHDLRGSE